jgi:LemA protein
VGWIVLVVLTALALAAVALYNRIIVLENRLKNAWAQVDVQLRRRNDLIPNLLETVRGYAGHERELFARLGEARERSLRATSIPEQAEAANQVTAALRGVFAVAENYPELRANENFLALQSELSETENKIAYARQFYNDAVLQFNNAIQTVPGVFLAGPMGKREQEPLETPAEERRVPEVAF